ncbi:leptin a [Aulostomus maculatus]
MDYSTLAILFSLLQVLSVGTAAPLPEEKMKMKSKLKLMAEQLVVRLDKDFQAPAGREAHAPANLDRLSSIVIVLDSYNSLISDSLNGVAQVKSDISSLTGYLFKWKQDHCSEQQLKPPVLDSLQYLQRRKDDYIHTVSIEALMGVKEFISQLLRNLDQLEIC